MKSIGLRRMACVLSLAAGVGMAPAVHAQQPPGMTARVSEILQAATDAREAGDGAREREILERGIATVGAGGNEVYFLYLQLGTHYADLGNMARAAELMERAYAVARTPVQEFNPVIRGLAMHSALHDKARTQEYAGRLDSLAPRLRSAPGWTRFGGLWQAGMAWAKASAFRSSGHLDEAQTAYAACLAAAEQFLQAAPDNVGGMFYMVDCTTGAMQMQVATGQLAAAAAAADQLRVAVERMARVARRPSIATRVGGVLGRLAIEQGRTDEARRILLDTLGKFLEDKESSASLRVAALLHALAQVEMLQGRWDKALEWHMQREAALRGMGAERGNMGTFSPDYAYTLLRLGKAAEALAMMQRVAAARGELHDENSLPLWEGRAFLGVALAAAGRRDEALRELRTALPRLLDIMKGERTSSEAGVLRTARLNWLLDAYIALLAEQAGDGTPHAAAAVDEAFRMADLARGSMVQRALAAAASRANVADPALAELTRREQDLQREIASLAEAIGNLLSRGRIAEQDRIVADMRADLGRLRQAHARAAAEIEARFPEYAALLAPKPVGIVALQRLLKPDEAVIAVYAGRDRTLVWAVPASGAPKFAVVPLGGDQLDLKVGALRDRLAPEGDGGLPQFPFDLAHELYVQLLAPVATGWQGAKELIVIPHGRLGQLPFGVLLTAPFKAGPAKIPYAEMADAPWLIKQVAISQMPAAVALPALRAHGAGRRGERPFIGFGDPLFGAPAKPAGGAALRGALVRRSLAVPAAAAAAATEAGASQAIDFRLLPPLPDTSLEIAEIARVLSADAVRDVYLQARASEAQVKQTDFSSYRVVMFATHGLTGGEMPGVYQPALALSNPALVGNGEDGMLTMAEILGLKLHADWVVLSACNTAAAGAQSTEFVSGLGRAFFYAGAKSLLVTNWAVETESARLLTTDLFRRQAADPGLTRARALQQSSLALMKQTSGQRFSYAHPLFWAPYTLVGDGG